VVKEGAEVKGRVIVYQNPAIHHQGAPTIQLGTFWSVDDISAVSALLEAAFDLGRKLGATFAIGPINGSTWNQYRFVTYTDGSPSFFTDMAYTEHYPRLWMEAGFLPVHEYVTNTAPLHDGQTGSGSFFEDHGLVMRNIDVSRLKEELRGLHPLCMAAFANNVYFSPISEDDFIDRYWPFLPLISRGFTRIVSNASGEPVAFILCLPEPIEEKAHTLVLKTVAKHPACTIRGVVSNLYSDIVVDAREAGFRRMIHAFMHVDNKSLVRSVQFEGTTIRRFALYAKQL
jgi:hypothetical protein